MATTKTGRPRGRPAKGQHPLNRTLAVRLSDPQIKDIDRAAAALGVPPTALLRAVAMLAIEVMLGPPEIATPMRQRVRVAIADEAW